MDKTAFASIFINLVENALKYGGEHSKVNIDLNLSDAELCLRVLDHGPGIKEHEKKLIFSRFYRSGNEETRNTRGTGLGLFIVAQLVKAMKGKIKVENNHSQGSVFEVVFPVHPSA
jgi:signal transduction histidine kinase